MTSQEAGLCHFLPPKNGIRRMTGDGAARDERKCISRVAKVNAVPACYVGVWWQPIRCAACPPPPLPLPTRRAGRGARRVRGSTRPSGGYAFEGRRRTAVASELGSCAQLVFPLIFPLFLLLLFNFISSPLSLSYRSQSQCLFHLLELDVVVDQLNQQPRGALHSCQFITKSHVTNCLKNLNF